MTVVIKDYIEAMRDNDGYKGESTARALGFGLALIADAIVHSAGLITDKLDYIAYGNSSHPGAIEMISMKDGD